MATKVKAKKPQPKAKSRPKKPAKVVAAKKATPNESSETRVIAKKDFDRAGKRYAELKKSASSATGSISTMLQEYEANHNLNRRAAKLVWDMLKKDPPVIASFLRSFDAMRDYAKLDDLAGKDFFEGETHKKSTKTNKRKTLGEQMREPGGALANGGDAEDESQSEDATDPIASDGGDDRPSVTH